MKICRKLLLVFLFAASFSSYANEVTFSSKDKKAIVLELFTSQGCSSCPPAEEYINEFVNNSELWSKYIPIVFHVDYWDYIGWKDVFAKPKFTSRQYRYAKLKHVRTVYTPAFIANGTAWRRGFFNSYPNVNGLNNGILDIVVDGNSVKAKFKSTLSGDDALNLNIAILGMDMVVNILAGENEGRKARHNFVVLGYNSQLSNNMTWKMKRPKIKRQTSSKFGFVAWVSSKGDPTPLQAVGGWLPVESEIIK